MPWAVMLRLFNAVKSLLSRLGSPAGACVKLTVRSVRVSSTSVRTGQVVPTPYSDLTLCAERHVSEMTYKEYIPDINLNYLFFCRMTTGAWMKMPHCCLKEEHVASRCSSFSCEGLQFRVGMAIAIR